MKNTSVEDKVSLNILILTKELKIKKKHQWFRNVFQNRKKKTSSRINSRSAFEQSRIFFKVCNFTLFLKVFLQDYFNPLFFLYPLKTLKKTEILYCFQGLQKNKIGQKWNEKFIRCSDLFAFVRKILISQFSIPQATFTLIYILIIYVLLVNKVIYKC